MTLPDPKTSAKTPVVTLALETAWARYESIRDRLPAICGQKVTRHVNSLLDVAAEFDGFVFDSFGVLNVGETAIPGAADCLAALRRMGKRLRILTNAASYTGDAAMAKYRRMGLEVLRHEIISSRDVTFAHLNTVAPGLRWGAIATKEDDFADAGGLRIIDILAPGASWEKIAGFVFLSSARWTPDHQERLVASLIQRPRPVVIGNPDLVAPREDGLSIEPGFWAHDLQDRTGITPHMFGKPYPEAFVMALAGMGPGRHAMIGDTLHTDILGGQAAGLATILVTDHGLFAGHKTAPYIAQSGIVPDISLPSI